MQILKSQDYLNRTYGKHSTMQTCLACEIQSIGNQSKNKKEDDGAGETAPCSTKVQAAMDENLTSDPRTYWIWLHVSCNSLVLCGEERGGLLQFVGRQ